MRNDQGQALTKKIHPGLSSLMYNPEQSYEYLQPIIKFARDSIPRKSHKATSIYLLATAGMRLLDPETQLEIMNDIIEDFRDQNLFATFERKVISGATEGMYQWITVNSLAKRFKVNEPIEELKQTTTDKMINNQSTTMKAISNINTNNNKTFALIEMGGASIQVTYQLTDKLNQQLRTQLRARGAEVLAAFKGQIIEPKISRQAEEFNYRLVSTTFLGFGSNSARMTFVDLLVNRYLSETKLYESRHQMGRVYTKRAPLVLSDPCLPEGSSETVTRPACVLSTPETASQTIGFNIEEDDITVSVHLKGTGNYKQCYSSLREMLSRAKREKLNCKRNDLATCTMNLIGEQFIPFDEYEFLGLSDFYYTTNEMLKMSGKYKKAAIVEKTKEICQTPYKKLLVMYPEANKFDKSRVLRECFKAVWIDIFLSDALSMPDEYENFNTVGKINVNDIDWTLGAVLDNSLNMEIAAENSSIEDYEAEGEDKDEDENEDQDEDNDDDDDRNHLSFEEDE